MKNPMTPSGIEPATSRFVAQHLNHCATMVPPKWGGWLDETSTNIFGCYVKVNMVPHELKNSAYTDILQGALFHKITI